MVIVSSAKRGGLKDSKKTEIREREREREREEKTFFNLGKEHLRLAYSFVIGWVQK
ncbi:MAG: hypothetical protein WC357_08730 [Candidatus Omnitrophota bacterium]